MMRRKFKLTAHGGQDITDEMDSFARWIGLERVAPNRYSVLLVLYLYSGLHSGQLNPAKVVHEIAALENGEKKSRTKPPIQNKHAPLKGLWHKHYLEDGLQSIAINVKRGIGKYGFPLFEERAREAEALGEERVVAMEDIDAIVADFTHGNWMRLVREKALTGEWIVYARHNGENYYLCLGAHDKETHEELRRQIDLLCCQEFPFLHDLLANA